MIGCSTPFHDAERRTTISSRRGASCYVEQLRLVPFVPNTYCADAWLYFAVRSLMGRDRPNHVVNRMKIRRGVAGDEKAISFIGRGSFSWAFGHLYPPDVLERYLDVTYSVPKIASSLSESDNVYFVAELENELVGFLKLKQSCHHQMIHRDCQVQVQKVYVLPNFANSGVGTGLMQTVDAELSEIPSVSAWLMVYEENRRAVSFYERFGYRVIGKDTYDFENVRVQFSVMEKTYWN
jgi:ribosomal protein S18 acetylase RimI-like enzyme